MATYLLRRLVLLVPILFGVTAVTFGLLSALQGDSATAILADNPEVKISPETIAAFRAKYGLDQPLPVRYANYVARLIQGDLGRSYATHQPVLELIGSRLPATLQLSLASIVVSLAIAVPLGILSATRRGTLIDGFAMVISTLGVSMPSFWLGLMLILLFALGLGWLPTSGRGTEPLEVLRHLVLPALTLGAAGAGLLARLIRASLIEVLEQEYITTARAKGLRERFVVGRHALKNGAIPIVSLIGIQIGAVLSGAVITETVFAWPGIGRLAVESITRRDLPVVQGVVLISALLFLVVNVLVDISYTFLNPRIRLATT